MSGGVGQPHAKNAATFALPGGDLPAFETAKPLGSMNPLRDFHEFCNLLHQARIAADIFLTCNCYQMVVSQKWGNPI